MAYKIIGETIRSATSIRLGQLFDNPIRYKENITKPKYPNFSINQLTLDETPAGKDRIKLDYLVTIQYRVAENTENITNLQQQLDEVGFKLCSQFKELQLGRPVKIKNANYEKADGVLNFFFNVTVYAYPEEEEGVKQNKLNLNEEVK